MSGRGPMTKPMPFGVRRRIDLGHAGIISLEVAQRRRGGPFVFEMTLPWTTGIL
jgi:hypothetical protein